MISVVMAYYNRKQQLEATLKSIAKQSVADVEVIVVDDASSEDHRIEDLTDQYSFLKPIRIDSKDFKNPCIPYNIGFAAANGDAIVIQNPECAHVGELLLSVCDNIDDSSYLSYASYCATEAKSQKVISAIEDSESVRHLINSFPQTDATRHSPPFGWYNHSYYRPCSFHFTTAMTRKNLEEMNGFDERYANGMEYDDNDILLRVNRKGLEIKHIDDPFSVHLWHESSYVNFEIGGVEYTHQQLSQINANVFHNHTMKETSFSAGHNEYYNNSRN